MSSLHQKPVFVTEATPNFTEHVKKEVLWRSLTWDHSSFMLQGWFYFSAEGLDRHRWTLVSAGGAVYVGQTFPAGQVQEALEATLTDDVLDNVLRANEWVEEMRETATRIIEADTSLVESKCGGRA